jgi:hypothetical protein
MEVVEEIKQLNAALIKEKDEKIALLEKLLNGKIESHQDNRATLMVAFYIL